MNRRTNSLTAAALSIGVDADLLESILPDLKRITEQIRKRDTTVGNVSLLVWAEYTIPGEGGSWEERSAHIIPLKQCGTQGADPCTCGE